MTNKKIKIICTLGPSSLNKKFLNFAKKNNVNLLRLNMSHLSKENLIKSINFIKKNCPIPICIDTEGAQIRTKVKKEKFIRSGKILIINDTKKNFHLYPEYISERIKKNDLLDIGFNNLKVKVLKKKEKEIICKVISSGKLENNKGVHVANRKIKINYLTQKDLEAIKIGKKHKIKNFALSFTNSISDVLNFNKLLPNQNKIFKIETLNACNDFHKIIKHADNFLIDRGDLSKDVKVENIPIFQRNLFKIKNKSKKNIFVATNLLESMIENSFPTRGEANDIFNSLEMGANGLVLAAETAIGKNPMNTVKFLNKMIKAFKKSTYKKFRYF